MNNAGSILIIRDDALLFYSRNEAKTVMLFLPKTHRRENAGQINGSVNIIVRFLFQC